MRECHGIEGGGWWRISRRSASSADRGSTRCSTTSARRRSTRRTDRRRTACFLATIAGRRVAFLPRHGRRHTIPPHRINYRANVWAMRSLGVKAVISPCAAGSLQLAVEPGHFVVSDQFVDRTTGREDTFFDGPIVSHVSSAETYDPTLRADRPRRHPRARHHRPRRRHRRRDPGPALLDQGRVEVVQRRRLAGHQHDPVPRGLPVSRARDGRRQHRPDHRLRRRACSRAPRPSPPTTCSRCSSRTRSGSAPSCWTWSGDSRPTSTRWAPATRCAHTRGDGHAAGDADIRIFETGLLAADRMTSMPTTPTPAAAPAPAEPMHGCVRCGARIPISESMCERCNPLGLKAPAASQAHGTAILGRRGRASSCSPSSRGSRSPASGRSRRAWSPCGADPGRAAGDDLDHQRRLERRRDDLPDRRPGAARDRAGDGVRPEPDRPARGDGDVRRGRDQPRDDAEAAQRRLRAGDDRARSRAGLRPTSRSRGRSPSGRAGSCSSATSGWSRSTTSRRGTS